MGIQDDKEESQCGKFWALKIVFGSQPHFYPQSLILNLHIFDKRYISSKLVCTKLTKRIVHKVLFLIIIFIFQIYSMLILNALSLLLSFILIRFSFIKFRTPVQFRVYGMVTINHNSAWSVSGEFTIYTIPYNYRVYSRL